MDSLRVNVVYLSSVSCLSQNGLYVRRISHNEFPNISSGNSLLFLQIWFRERKGLGILMFLVGVLIDVFVALMPYIVFWDWTGIINSLDFIFQLFLFLFLLLKSCPNSTMKYIFPPKQCVLSSHSALNYIVRTAYTVWISLQKQRTNTLKITPKEPLLSPS